MISHQMTLDYDLAPGWMTPFVNGLLAGKAAALECSQCNRVSFPPVRVCKCGSDNSDWKELSGKATIIHRTDGLDGSFALVKFIGSDTCSIANVENIETGNDQGWLSIASGSLPSIILQNDKRDD